MTFENNVTNEENCQYNHIPVPIIDAQCVLLLIQSQHINRQQSVGPTEA